MDEVIRDGCKRDPLNPPTLDHIACPMETPIVEPSCLSSPTVAVLVAISLEGIAACIATIGGKKRPPTPSPAISGNTS